MKDLFSDPWVTFPSSLELPAGMDIGGGRSDRVISPSRSLRAAVERQNHLIEEAVDAGALLLLFPVVGRRNWTQGKGRVVDAAPVPVDGDAAKDHGLILRNGVGTKPVREVPFPFGVLHHRGSGDMAYPLLYPVPYLADHSDEVGAAIANRLSQITISAGRHSGQESSESVMEDGCRVSSSCVRFQGPEHEALCAWTADCHGSAPCCDGWTPCW